MTLVGGMGTLAGPMLGAIIIIALENKLGDWGTLLAQVTGVEWFNTIGEAVNMVVGLIFIICVLLFRRGIIGEFIALAGKKKPV
jgi:branched-chain amino acid transport system permease protein